MKNLNIVAKIVFSQLAVVGSVLLLFAGSSLPWYLAAAAAVLVFLYVELNLLKSLRQFAEAIRILKTESKQAHQTGRHLVKAANSLASTSNDQAASIEETSASLEEMNSMINLSAKNSDSAKALSSQATEKATEGESSMNFLISSMEEVSESSKKIEEIMTIIDDIAFQINLLALNASVEAARAGEHGRGFAVVAEAVRNLAHKSAASAKEIANLTHESIEKIDRAQKLALESGQSVAAIREHINKVSINNNEIATASAEQAQGINQISKAIMVLEKGTIENSSIANETLQFSKKSLEQAEGLLRVVDVLESEISGKKSQKAESNVDLDFDSAVEAHLKWKARLSNFVSGMSKEDLKSANICKDDQCILGKWIHGPGSQHMNFQSYQVLKKNHAHFHKAAGAVVAAVEKNNRALAQDLLKDNSDFNKYTDLTVEAIYSLQEDVEKKPQKKAAA